MAAMMQADQDGAAQDERLALNERLAARILHHLPQAGDHDSAVPGLSFYRRDDFCPPASTLYEPSLSLVIQGRKHVLLGNQAYEYGAGDFMLTAIDLPTIAQVLDGSADYPFLSILLKLDIATIKEVAGEIDLHGAVAGAVDSGMAVGTATSELLDAFLRLMALADTPRDIPILGKLLMREVVYRLLLGPAGAHLRSIAVQGSRCGRMAGVIAHLRDNYAQPVRIEELAEMAAMGISTLHHHFNGLTRMSPLQYQKHIRLHEARRLLLTEHLDAGSAAFRVGYESVTQFSREYRRLFGAPPMRDVAQLRQARRDATIAAQ
jgi:AraC-like DNA-binding protein